jgi:hypothetical protein
MPYTINGVGTTVYKGRGDVGWGSFDAVEWFVILYAPLIPIRTVHTFGWSGKNYRMLPIRWSAALVARSFMRAWTWWLVAAACLMLVIAVAQGGGQKPGGVIAAAVIASLGILLAGSALIFHFVLAAADRRADNIRRVLGPHQLGSCDPAVMKQPMNPDPRANYGTDSYADAVPALLDAERYSRAMWAARLSTAWEDPALGEELTDHILSHPGVPEAVEQVRRNPKGWADVMLSPAEREARQSKA